MLDYNLGLLLGLKERAYVSIFTEYSGYNGDDENDT